MLEVRSLSASYGDAAVLHEVSLQVEEGEIVALLGPNGAGKTTLVKAMARLIPMTAGEVSIDGASLSAVPQHRVAESGLAVVPEGRRLFTKMSVEENLEIGAYGKVARADLQASLELVYGLFPRLKERCAQRAGTLSGGEQQMVALGRGLMAKPKFLLMDEPSLGLSPLLVDTMFELIASIAELGVGVLLVEQNVSRTLQVAGRGYVLEQGRIVQAGARAELLDSPRIREAYLAL
jgi:branched-chain amino acid transport system ATP-binding protein